VATCSLNNARASLAMLEAGALSRILTRLPLEDDDEVRSKLVTALSSLLNDAPAARDYFFAQRGVELLQLLLERSTVSTTRAKLFYLAQKLIVLQRDRAATEFANGFLLPTLASLSDADRDVRTNCAKVIANLLDAPAMPAVMEQLSAFPELARARVNTLRSFGGDVACEHDDELRAFVCAVDNFEAARKRPPATPMSLALSAPRQ